MERLKLAGKRPEFWLGLLLGVGCLLGLFTVTHYGESWDEKLRYEYAEHSLAAYSGGESNLPDEKGPFYGMISYLGARALQLLLHGWKTIDAWHFMTFLSFLLGVYFFYRLCHRWVEGWPALATTALFATQPVIWGHAFINPKDIPFMTFFLGSVTLGLEMVEDHLQDEAHEREKWAAGWQRLRSEWRTAPRAAQRWMVGLFGGLVLLLASSFWVRKGIAILLHRAYHASSTDWLGRFFNQIASHAAQISPEAYVQKAQTVYSWALLSLAVLLIVALIRLARHNLPSLVDSTLMAGLFLGFASAIRTLGPASGALVGFYFLVKARKKALGPLLKYALVGGLGMIFFWPYLWSDPVGHFWNSITRTTDFSWSNPVTFAGQQWGAKNLPLSYLPVVFSIQLTEPALAVILAGFLLALLFLARQPKMRPDMLLLGVWWIAPLAFGVAFHSTIYDNFRQFLFVVPPLFILAGLTLQELWTKIHRPTVFALLALLCVLPGVYQDVQLHPYEYVYYNHLVGGVRGAFRKYELDYWCTSYKEATEYLNRVAPPGAVIFVDGPYQLAATYARSDLKIQRNTTGIETGAPLRADYAILPSRWNRDQLLYPQAPLVYAVERNGAVLAAVKQIPPPLP